jgi:hypothetical protein
MRPCLVGLARAQATVDQSKEEPLRRGKAPSEMSVARGAVGDLPRKAAKPAGVLGWLGCRARPRRVSETAEVKNIAVRIPPAVGMTAVDLNASGRGRDRVAAKRAHKLRARPRVTNSRRVAGGRAADWSATVKTFEHRPRIANPVANTSSPGGGRTDARSSRPGPCGARSSAPGDDATVVR